MRPCSSWRHIFVLLRSGDSCAYLPASFCDSVQHDKAMKILLSSGCDSCRDLQHGFSCISRGESHAQRIPTNNGSKGLGKLWESAHVRLQLPRAGIRYVVVSSGSSSVKGTENRVTTVPTLEAKVSGLQVGRFRRQGAGWLSFNSCRGFSSGTVGEYGRSRARIMSATESTGTSPLTEDFVKDDASDSDEQTEEQLRKKQQKKEKKKKVKEMKKLIKQGVKRELKKFFAEALERQNEPEDADAPVEDDDADVEELEDREEGALVEVVEEIEEVKTTVKRKVKKGVRIYAVGSLEELVDDVTDDEQDSTDVEEDDADVEDADADLEEDEDRDEVLDDLEDLEEAEIEVVEEVEEVETSIKLEIVQDEVDDEIADEDEDFWEDDVYSQDPEVGDGEDGGGTVLDDAEWGKAALSLALETLEKNFGSNFSLFGFKLSKNAGLIRVRLDKLTDKYGSPTLDDIERFSSIYGKLLDEEGLAKRLPDNLALEVSSPGAERIVRIPQDLERFKELPMYVRYTLEGGAKDSVKDGIWQVDKVEVDKAVWKLANVRANREVAGKGRPLNKKQKEWRLELPFSNTHLVRLYLDV